MKSEVEILSHWTTNRFTFFFWKWSIPNHQKSLKKNSPLPNHDPRFLCLVQPLKVQQQDSLFSNIFLMLKKCCAGLKIAPCHLWTKRLGVASFWKPLVKTGNDELTPTPTNPKLPKKNWVILSHVTKGWMKPPFTNTTLKKWRLTICIMYIYIYELDIIHPFCSLFSLFPLLHGGSVFGNGFSHLRNYKLGVKHGTQEKST